MEHGIWYNTQEGRVESKKQDEKKSRVSITACFQALHTNNQQNRLSSNARWPPGLMLALKEIHSKPLLDKVQVKSPVDLQFFHHFVTLSYLNTYICIYELGTLQ